MKLGVCTLDQIARVRLGFKSLQNKFYYVTEHTIEKFGIESRYLRPVLQLSDLATEKYKQTATGSLRVFYCKDKEQDLHGTGALKYIRDMENIPAAVKKQTQKKQTIKSALQEQTSFGGTWYMPKAKLHRMHIWLRKGFDTVYSPFVFENAAAMDQRCNYVLPAKGLKWELVAATLTSSLFAFSAESYGSAAMGAGVLELATTMTHGLRVVDVRTLKDAGAVKELLGLAEKVWEKTTPVNWAVVEQPPGEVQELDRWFLSHLDTRVTLVRVYADLVATLRSRLKVAEDKKLQAKKGEQIDIETVASGIAEAVRPLLESRSFPESFVHKAAITQPVDLSHAGELAIDCHPMMDQAILLVTHGSDFLLQGQYPRSIAQVIIKALLMGRRKFNHPTDPVDAETALTGFAGWFPKILNKIATGCALSAVGTAYETHVHEAVLQQLHLDSHISLPEFYGHLTIH